jgi:hypothetical protein
MRTLLLSLGLVCFAGASAQNWALLNPAYKYNYSNDGSDTISNQIFVTRIDTLGVDSFRYELNRIGVVCDTCTSLQGSCDGPFGDELMLGDQPQYLNTKDMIRGANFWRLGDDSLVIFSSANTGSTWTIGLGLSATVVSTTQITVFGVLDSAKVISISNGSEVTLSKEHGMLSVPRDLFSPMDELTLVGIEGMALGEHFPTVDDIFDYTSGDVLQYDAWNGGNCGGVPLYQCHATDKLTILQRSDTAGYPTYSLRRVMCRQCSGCNSSFSTSIDTIPFNTHGCQDDLLALALRKLWPGSIAQGGTWCDEGYPWNISWEASLNVDQHYVLQTPEFDGYQKTLRLCQPDSSAYVIDYGGAFYDSFQYEEGVGLRYYSTFFFEGWSSRTLAACSIDGIQTGSIASDDSILLGLTLGFNEEGSDPSWVVAPNPIVDRAMIVHSLSSPASWQLFEASGKQVAQGTFMGKQGTIEAGQLPEGIYFLRMTCAEDSACRRLVVAR